VGGMICLFVRCSTPLSVSVSKLLCTVYGWVGGGGVGLSEGGRGNVVRTSV
jgi:hypothetical protein